MKKTDNSSFDIVQCKVFADGEKYFSLFDRRIPTLGSGQTVLLYSIDNIDCISRIVKKNPEASYVVYGDRFVNACVKSVFPFVETIDETSENRKVYNIDMKFDCVIMNPPYNNNLHLKILAETIKHLKDDNSKIVNLSPVRWLQDPGAELKKTADYKKFKSSIADHIQDLTIISVNDSQKLFSIEILSDLGIYICSKNIQNFNRNEIPSVKEWKHIHSWFKTLRSLNDLKINSNNKSISKFFVPICLIIGGSGGRVGTDIMFSKTGKIFNGQKTNNRIFGIDFDSKQEADNFYNTCKTNVYRFFVLKHTISQNVDFNLLPWMGDCVNPRTGKKGYESEWTDEDFYKFFNIMPDEQKIIEETMAKYAK